MRLHVACLELIPCVLLIGAHCGLAYLMFRTSALYQHRTALGYCTTGPTRHVPGTAPRNMIALRVHHVRMMRTTGELHRGP